MHLDQEIVRTDERVLHVPKRQAVLPFPRFDHN
jgi:hypothetical protein